MLTPPATEGFEDWNRRSGAGPEKAVEREPGTIKYQDRTPVEELLARNISKASSICPSTWLLNATNGSRLKSELSHGC